MSFYIETDGEKKGTWEILRFNANRIRVGQLAGKLLRVKLPERKVKVFTRTLQILITLDEYLSEHGQVAFTESKVALEIYGEAITPVIELCKQPIANRHMPGTKITFKDFFTQKALTDFHRLVNEIADDYYEFESNGVIEVPLYRAGNLLWLSLRQFNDLSEDELFRLLQHIPAHLWFNLVRNRSDRTILRDRIQIDSDRYVRATPSLDVALNSHLRFYDNKLVSSPIEIPPDEKLRFAGAMNWLKVSKKNCIGDGASSFIDEFKLILELSNVGIDIETYHSKPHWFNDRNNERIKGLTGESYGSIIEHVDALCVAFSPDISFDTLQQLFVDFLHAWYIKWRDYITEAI